MSRIWDAMKQAERERERLHVVSDDQEYRPLTTKQLAAVAALTETGAIDEACRRSGVSERTMLRWLATPRFALAYRKASHSRYMDALASLRSATSEAVEALRGALHGPSESGRIQAAVAILDLAAKSEPTEKVERPPRSRNKRTD